jgi:hypothetical protein
MLTWRVGAVGLMLATALGSAAKTSAGVTRPQFSHEPLRLDARALAAARSARILYVGDWSGHPQIYVADPARPAFRGQLTFGGEGFVEPLPSPNGRRLAYQAPPGFPAGDPHGLWIAQANGIGATRIATGSVGGVMWSPDSTQLAYWVGGKLHVVRAGGTGDRVVQSAPAWYRQGVSPDGRWRMTLSVRSGKIIGFTVSNGPTTHTFDATSAGVWSPDSRKLAYARPEGIYVADVRTGRYRRLTSRMGFELAWAPDGGSLAFVQGTRGWESSSVYTSATGPVLTVTLSGRVRSVVDSERAYGGTIVSIAWVKPHATVRYRKPEAAPSTRVAPLGLLAGGSISRIAADGSLIAFVACGNVFSWSPMTGAVTALRESEPLSICHTRESWIGYSLAVAGNRVAYGVKGPGCHSFDVSLELESMAPTRTRSELARSRGQCGSPYNPGVGWLVGSGDLLAYSAWNETCSFPPGCSSTSYTTTSQRIHRVPAGGCPCPAVASSPGPLIPADADAGRIVAYGDNATLVLDANGKLLLTIAVSPLAAQLSGSDLALVLRGQVRHYDAVTGLLLHAWPLPDVPSGARCEYRCARTGEEPRLLVEDLARGLLAYVLDGRVHLVRLADGVDTVVASGTQARFMDSGLVYADGTRLHVVPFARLPLR